MARGKTRVMRKCSPKPVQIKLLGVLYMRKDETKLMLIRGKQIFISENELDNLEAIRDALHVFLDKALPHASATSETLSNDFFEALLDKYPTPEEIEKLLEGETVYSGWAYTDSEKVKSMCNGVLYNKIKDLAKLERVGIDYGHKKYKVVSNPYGLTKDCLALIADEGNLCFGYRTQGELILIHTD